MLFRSEELIGAKQNRVLNTTILLEKKIKTTIPVSCVESGRWDYRTERFSSSDRVAPASLKFNKNMTVTDNLKKSKGMSFRSDQGQVWDDVSRYMNEAKVISPSQAMSDVYEKRRDNIDNYLKEFKITEQQNGMIVFMNGKLTGFEYISNISAFSKLYDKLIRGYAMDAMINPSDKKTNGYEEIAQNFLTKIQSAKEDVFKSVGIGSDHRLEANDFVGSALISETEVIHLSILMKNLASTTEPEMKTRPYIRRTIR